MEDDQYRGMWMTVQEDVRISCLCKDWFDKLLEAFLNEKGTDSQVTKTVEHMN